MNNRQLEPFRQNHRELYIKLAGMIQPQRTQNPPLENAKRDKHGNLAALLT